LGPRKRSVSRDAAMRRSRSKGGADHHPPVMPHIIAPAYVSMEKGMSARGAAPHAVRRSGARRLVIQRGGARVRAPLAAPHDDDEIQREQNQFMRDVELEKFRNRQVAA